MIEPLYDVSKGYTIIYADPPWAYRDKANAGKRGASHKYDVMTVDELKQLAVNDLAAPDCLLAMWWVAPMPEEAIEVMKAWGFTLKTMKGFTWHKYRSKIDKKTGEKIIKEHIGMGHWTRANSEDCLIAIRGKPKVINHGVRQFLSSPYRGHSTKPDEVRDRLVQLMGDVPRIELFARQRHPGWDAWGNEL